MTYYQESLTNYIDHILLEEKRLKHQLASIQRHIDAIITTYGRMYDPKSIFISRIAPNLPEEILSNKQVLGQLEQLFTVSDQTIIEWREDSDMMET